jgi:hypothetical protein
MNRYLVESPHTAQDCARMIKDVYSLGSLTHFDWGCEAGVHTGWAIVEAASEDEALFVVPPLVRHQARAIRLVKYSPDDVKTW